ncbi:NAD(P)-dependent alcohol dehydrogenase [Gilvimarinus algae]|uniref:NAD(P)-dependent alcohol dehydrogenase n=1 Tax=Gilvimarinus algae TaxID=3058037 RepID=A0ABT8T906_9GAMM|nr:NAD(P)-dependent alcohol dehydrogenase [Gilvimarinus sp. SDUM040014]MDO3380617.1 NAD(P)-dependent alcohol dehydrogenase [Gilvimarinus sp. SDUM040014]
MQAVVFTRYGGPEQLQLSLRDKPVPEPGQVLLRVQAVALNDWDLQALKGTPFVNRVMFGLFKPHKQILGSDVVGVVEALGEGVTQFALGETLVGDISGTWGGLAEYVCVSESLLTVKPDTLSAVQAAALPQAGLLAQQGLFDVGRLLPGQSMLINGAGGGVGCFAVQMAKQLGARVTAVDSANKLDGLLTLGADHVLDYQTQDFTRLEERYDLVLDVKTNRLPSAYARALKDGGVYVTVGGQIRHLLTLLVASPFYRWRHKRHLRIVALKPNSGIERLLNEVQAGRLQVQVDHVYPLADTAEAFRRLDEARHFGKVLVSVGQ